MLSTSLRVPYCAYLTITHILLRMSYCACLIAHVLYLLKIFQFADRADPAERVEHRQSLLNRLNRADRADPTKIVRKETFQIWAMLVFYFFLDFY